MCVTLNSDGFELAPPIASTSAAAEASDSKNHSALGGEMVGADDSVTKSAVYRPEDVRTPRPGTWQGTSIKGRLTGKSTGTKRPTFSNSNARSGMPQRWC